MQNILHEKKFHNIKIENYYENEKKNLRKTNNTILIKNFKVFEVLDEPGK